jgi:hypothetical protein
MQKYLSKPAMAAMAQLRSDAKSMFQKEARPAAMAATAAMLSLLQIEI